MLAQAQAGEATAVVGIRAGGIEPDRFLEVVQGQPRCVRYGINPAPEPDKSRPITSQSHGVGEVLDGAREVRICSRARARRS